MKPRSLLLLAVLFTLCLLSVGLPYWRLPYSKVSLPSTLWTPALLLVAVIPALSRPLSLHPLVAGFVTGASVPIAVMARVVHDTAVDPTSHNLWPLELVIAGFLGFAFSLAGAFAGWLIARMSGRRAA